jgi:phosphoenolpyruvate---glycerone phosphotransferase subunit DhaM
MKIALLVVSHSKKLAEGVKELVSQMANGVTIEACGGMSDGTLGTDSVAISEAMGALALENEMVLTFMDLGSGVISSQMALDLLEDDVRVKVKLVDASLIEGAFTAGVLVSAGMPLEEIIRQAENAGKSRKIYE